VTSNPHDSNPYTSPQAGERSAAGETTVRSSLRIVRILFYAHLVFVCLCAVFSLLETGQIELPRYVAWWFYFPVVQAPMVLSWLLFPAMMIIAAARLPNRSPGFRVAVVAGDILLSMFQLWVMLPLV
jgi:hypothetical protein